MRIIKTVTIVVLSLIAIIIMLFVFNGISWVNNYNKYGFENYKNTRWECSDPDIIYYIPKIDWYNAEASTVIEGDKKIFRFDLINQYVEANMYSNDPFYHDPLFTGTINYYEDKFIITIDRDSDTLFNGKYSKLVFERIKNAGND